ncbi:ABC transporter integral membrane type 1 [Penicillium sp. IBT 18751x]|nr:ABC transporter integral membrane type 1 [Penicillium sp. IBT 18751x]
MQAVTVTSQSDHGLLESLRTYNPLVLLLLFILVCVVDTVVVVRKANKVDSGSGPNKCSFCQQHEGWVADKGYFKELSVAVLMTYIVDMITYIIHVKVAWSEHWWGGESMVINLVCSAFLHHGFDDCARC